MDQIKSTSDMMLSLQDEINAVKNGTLTESQARVVFRGRALQLKTAELNIQYQRLHRGRKPEMEMPLIAAAAVESNGDSATPEPEKK